MIIEKLKITMNKNLKSFFNCLPLLIMLNACVLPPIPDANKDTAIILLYTQPGRSLMAESIDRQRVNDGRYFQVTEGKHRLALRFQYEKNEIGGLISQDLGQTTCLMSFYYLFKANQTYYLEARPMVTGGQLLLTLNNNYLPLDFSDVEVNCGPY